MLSIKKKRPDAAGAADRLPPVLTYRLLIVGMLPTRFELVAFHLGGERSIQLSYGSLSISDLGFRNVDLSKPQA